MIIPAKISNVQTVALQGLDVIGVDVQVQITKGQRPSFILVGLPDKAVAESRERIRSALISMGISLPVGRVTVNLSPADIQKEGSLYDVPITVAILGAMGILEPEDLLGYVFLGELSLDGTLGSVRGLLPAALHAKQKGLGIVCSHGQAQEAAWIEGVPVLGFKTLSRLLAHFRAEHIEAFTSAPLEAEAPDVLDTKEAVADMKNIRGQAMARRALEIAAAGEHNMLMNGPPGVGKSLLAKALGGILPPMTAQEVLETSMIYSAAGQLAGGDLIRRRPFREPHHSASLVSLIGGGAQAHPGEVSLAHRGVLFLDELAEFQRSTLEALRQPLENGVIQVSRARAFYTYPASLQLIAAMNPCRCGYLHDARRACSKAPQCAQQYMSRISGPFLDRLDLFVEVALVPVDVLARAQESESSAAVRQRVVEARRRQYDRYGPPYTNAKIAFDVLHRHLRVTEEASAYLNKTVHQQALSARAYHRSLRVAQTIADLDRVEDVGLAHVKEALAYRYVAGRL